MAVTIEPQGGLGNQLFIYGLGLRLAHERKTELVSDLWNFHGYGWHNYELDSFQNSISRTYSSKGREIFGHKTRGLVRRARSLHVDPTFVSRLVLENDARFDARLLATQNGSRLNGYFQSWKYFGPIADELKMQISSPENPSQWLSDSRLKLQQLGPWVAVHVRRGTYLQVPIMGIVDNDYYLRAISLLDKIVGELPLVLFSDSPELLTDLHLRLGDRISIVSTPESVRPIDVMQVMSDAHHLVIANSTFSWWAAYLKDRSDRFVVAPRPWLDDRNFNERDLLPHDWLTLGRESVWHDN